jgi:lia operon protein LiaG
MKVLAIIFTCIFFISLTGFIVTVALTGTEITEMVRSGNFNMGFRFNTSGHLGVQNLNAELTESYKDIEINILSARTNIKISPDNITRVNYSSSNPHLTIDAVTSGDRLIIRERREGWIFFNFGSGTSRLDIEIPENVYNKLNINATSGTINAIVPECDEIYLSITSGRVTLDADNMNLCYLESRATSGTININGFMPETYSFHVNSGRLNVTELTGSGRVRMTSGRADIYFAEWNGSLDVNITSGHANIIVPKGSGAYLRFTRTSGSLRYDLDSGSGSDSGKMSGSGNINIGGSNMQDVSVNMTSGSMTINNN